MPDQSKLITVPDGKLGIIALKSSEKLGAKVDEYLVKWRKEREHINNIPPHLLRNPKNQHQHGQGTDDGGYRHSGIAKVA